MGGLWCDWGTSDERGGFWYDGGRLWCEDGALMWQGTSYVVEGLWYYKGTLWRGFSKVMWGLWWEGGLLIWWGDSYVIWGVELLMWWGSSAIFPQLIPSAAILDLGVSYDFPMNHSRLPIAHAWEYTTPFPGGPGFWAQGAGPWQPALIGSGRLAPSSGRN